MKNPFVINVSYRWTHVPTGTTGVRTVETDNLQTFINQLAQWNLVSVDWHYDILEGV